MVRKEDAIAVAKKARTGAAIWLTRTANECEMLSQDLSAVGVLQYEAAVDNFNKRLSNWDKAEDILESQVPESALETLIEGAADYRASVESRLQAMVAAWRELQEVKSEEKVQAYNKSVQQSIKLPKLELPKFGGDVLQFQTFWQQFTACIDSQEDVPDITKFNYLIGLLMGAAKSTLDGLPVTADNYSVAKEIIKKRFGRRDLLIFAHIQTLLTLPIASKAEELTVSYDKLVANVRALKSMEITSDNYGVVLTPIIVSRLSAEIREEWSRGSEGHEADLDHLMGFLDKEIRRRERCQSMSELCWEQNRDSCVPVQRSVSSLQQNRDSYVPVQSSVSSLRVNCDPTIPCAFCMQSIHSSFQCSTYLDTEVKARQDMVFKARLCFRCLGRNHIARVCDELCGNCGGRHHQTLCYKQLENKEGSEQDASVNSEGKQQSEPVNVLTVCHDSFKSVPLLPIAKVKVRGVNDSWHVANLLFDSGSDRSFVTHDIVRLAKPKWMRNCEASFSTFGGHKLGSKSNVFGLSLQSAKGGEEVQVELSEVPVICSPFARPVLNAQWLDAFKHLDLAYDFAEKGDLSVDILIGQDLFWSLMVGNVFRDEKSGVVAQESTFGWVLSGSCSTNSNDGVTLLNMCTIQERIATSDESGILIAEADVGVVEEFKSRLGLRDACGQAFCEVQMFELAGEMSEDRTGVFVGPDGVCDSVVSDPCLNFGVEDWEVHGFLWSGWSRVKMIRFKRLLFFIECVVCLLFAVLLHSVVFSGMGESVHQGLDLLICQLICGWCVV